MITIIERLVTALFLYMSGHALADYALQSEFIAKYKNPNNKGIIPWYYVMSSHCLIHGLFVYIVTFFLINLYPTTIINIPFVCIMFSLFETFDHFVTDLWKCLGGIDIHKDQFMHFFTKGIFTTIIVGLSLV